MTLALTGLIFVQVFWIKNAVSIKEKQFDQLVSNALMDITEGIQKKEAIRLVMEEMAPNGEDTADFTGDGRTTSNAGTNLASPYDSVGNIHPRVLPVMEQKTVWDA